VGPDSLPWEAEEARFVPPFQVGELLVTSLDGFLTAAALHMGDKLADGRGLERTDPTEAWLALLGATGLLLELAPVLANEIKLPYQAILADLLKRYAEAFPDRSVPLPTKHPIGSLRDVISEAWAKLDVDSPLLEDNLGGDQKPLTVSAGAADEVNATVATPDGVPTSTGTVRPNLPVPPKTNSGTGPLGAQTMRSRSPGSGPLPSLPKLPGTAPLRNTPGLPDDKSKPK
jgi:hypothetical protein